MRVAAFASRPPITAEADISIREAARIMAERRIGLLVLTKGGELYGVVSERDIVRAIAEGVDVEKPVSSIAVTRVITVDADAHISEAAELFRRHGIRHLVVTKGGKLYGVLSIRDLVREREVLRHVADTFTPALDYVLPSGD